MYIKILTKKLSMAKDIKFLGHRQLILLYYGLILNMSKISVTLNFSSNRPN